MQKKTLTKNKTGARAAAVTAAMPEATSTTTTVVAATTAPSREEIAKRAYEIYVARGQTPGRELEDWIQAERELLAKAHRNN